MTISPERLRELIEMIQPFTRGHGIECASNFSAIVAALRELEQRRLAMAGVDAGESVIVPKEPTLNMIRVGSFSASDDGELEDWRDRTRANAVAGYKAMLAAAQQSETLQTVLADALSAAPPSPERGSTEGGT